MGFDCRGWRARGRVVLEAAGVGQGARLDWFVSGRQEASPRRWSQPGEALYGHAVSEDGSVVVAITGRGEAGSDGEAIGLGHRISLHVIRDGELEREERFTLEFPHRPEIRAPLFAPKNKYVARGLLRSVLAKRIAVSPDKRLVAVAYGIRTGDIHSDSVGYFGIYSLADGRRLATLKGDVFRNGLWPALRDWDLVPTAWAPARGVFFSPDSRWLYAVSDRIRQWDVSLVR